MGMKNKKDTGGYYFFRDSGEQEDRNKNKCVKPWNQINIRNPEPARRPSRELPSLAKHNKTPMPYGMIMKHAGISKIGQMYGRQPRAICNPIGMHPRSAPQDVKQPSAIPPPPPPPPISGDIHYSYC